MCCQICEDTGVLYKETICSCCLGRVEGCKYCGGLGFRTVGIECSCANNSRTTTATAKYYAVVRDLMQSWDD